MTGHTTLDRMTLTWLNLYANFSTAVSWRSGSIMEERRVLVEAMESL